MIIDRMPLAGRAAYLGEPAGDLSALVNPEIVDAIRQTSSALP